MVLGGMQGEDERTQTNAREDKILAGDFHSRACAGFCLARLPSEVRLLDRAQPLRAGTPRRRDFSILI